MHGAIMLIAPLFVAMIFDWYLLVFAYYLVLFGIFIYGEIGWKGVVFHLLFILALLLLASRSGDDRPAEREYFNTTVIDH